MNKRDYLNVVWHPCRPIMRLFGVLSLTSSVQDSKDDDDEEDDNVNRVAAKIMGVGTQTLCLPLDGIRYPLSGTRHSPYGS